MTDSEHPPRLPQPAPDQSLRPRYRDYEQLLSARRSAVAAIMEAEDVEQQAAAARRRATRLTKTYERLLMEYNGQQRLPGV